MSNVGEDNVGENNNGEDSRPSTGSSEEVRRRGTIVVTENEEADNSNVENEPPTEVETGVEETVGGERLFLEDRTEHSTDSIVRELLREIRQQREVLGEIGEELGRVQHEKKENEQEFRKRIENMEKLAEKSNNIKAYYPQKKRDNENEMKLISFRKVNKDESMSTQIRVLLGEAEAFEDIASKRKLLASISRSLPTDVMDNVSALWGTNTNHEEKWIAMKKFLKDRYRNEGDIHKLGNQLERFKFNEKEDISTQFATYLDMISKYNQQCNIAEKPGNKFTITSSMTQVIRKIGAVDKSLAMSINDSWEVSYGKMEDLYDLKTGDLQKLVAKKEMNKIMADNIDRDVRESKRLKTDSLATKVNMINGGLNQDPNTVNYIQSNNQQQQQQPRKEYDWNCWRCDTRYRTVNGRRTYCKCDMTPTCTVEGCTKPHLTKFHEAANKVSKWRRSNTQGRGATEKE